MYLATPHHVESFWEHLRTLLATQDLRHLPLHLNWPTDLPSHWLDPGLWLSQTCGYPLVTHLAGRVRLVGTFCYQVPGSTGHLCRSQLVVRAEDRNQSLTDFRGGTVAYNSTDSQSGYNSLRAMVAPLAEGGRFFDRAVASGSHLRSVELVITACALWWLPWPRAAASLTGQWHLAATSVLWSWCVTGWPISPALTA